MCSANKCCFCLRLDLGAVLIGIVSSFFSIAMIVTSAAFLTKDIEKDPKWLSTDNATYTAKSQSINIVHVKIIESFDMPLPTLHIILYSSLALGLMLLVASISLIIGLNNRKPSFILFYFGFGIFFVIFSQLGGLLMVLQKKWETPLIIFVTSLLYIHFLVVIHTIYEDMLKNGTMRRCDSMKRLVEEDTMSTVSIEASETPWLVTPGADRV